MFAGKACPNAIEKFVRSIIEERQPEIDVLRSANWTAAGISAHESAMLDGTEILIPDFD